MSRHRRLDDKKEELNPLGPSRSIAQERHSRK
jgi:hypothetical protein